MTRPHPFALYPQRADGARPWWTNTPQGWTRSDGLTVSTIHRSPWGWLVQGLIPGGEEVIPARDVPGGSVTEEVDRRWPAPLPPILVGQVWTSEEGEFSIVAVARVGDQVVAVVPQPGPSGDPVLVVVEVAAFGGLVLVRGDFSPWAPAGWDGWPESDDDGETP